MAKAPRQLFPYVVDEYSIAARVGHAVPPLRVFTLEGFGIDANSFIDFMRPTFSVLHLDPYDAKRNKVAFLKLRFPDADIRLDRFLVEYYAKREDLDGIIDIIHQLSEDDRHEFDRIGLTGRRKRSIARFLLRRDGISGQAEWQIRRVGASEFKQNVGKDDTRGLVRIFAEAPEFVTDHPDVRHLMQCLARMVGAERPEATALEMNLHQMFIFADLMSPGDNAPEGIHQDGADFIVSALVIERAGIIGGESVVYDLDRKTEYLRRTLAQGEGIFQADKGQLWHYVTPIQEDPAVPPAYGHRSILGFDIDVVG